MMIQLPGGVLEIVNESASLWGSADSARRYPDEVHLEEQGYLPTSRHGIEINGDPVVVFLAGGGCSTVHEHSAVHLDGCLYLAVGDHVVCLEIVSRKVKWAVPIDTATCFGVYYHSKLDALISHGELEIARFDRNGVILWTASGRDIFSEGVRLTEAWVEAVDFNRECYRFDYDTGDAVEASPAVRDRRRLRPPQQRHKTFEA
jgi:hypothetical protein